MTNGQIHIGPEARPKLGLTVDIAAGSGREVRPGWVTALHGGLSLASIRSAMTGVGLQG